MRHHESRTADITHLGQLFTTGRAVGNFIAFADIALGVTGPVVGLVTQWLGIRAAFLVGAGATCAALGLLAAVRLGRKA